MANVIAVQIVTDKVWLDEWYGGCEYVPDDLEGMVVGFYSDKFEIEEEAVGIEVTEGIEGEFVAYVFLDEDDPGTGTPVEVWTNDNPNGYRIDDFVCVGDDNVWHE